MHPKCSHRKSIHSQEELLVLLPPRKKTNSVIKAQFPCGSVFVDFKYILNEGNMRKNSGIRPSEKIIIFAGYICNAQSFKSVFK